MGLRFAVGRVSCTVGLERHKMKLSISNPSFAVTKKFLIEDEQKMKALYDRRMGDEFPADFLGEQFKGYVLKITGGTDKQGFAMMQGVLTAERVKLLLGEEHQCFNLHRRQKRRDTRKRKSVRGCITSAETSVLNMAIIKKGDKDIEGLTDEGSAIPNRMGPKRATKIRKLWNLSKTDDVRQYVIRRKVPKAKNPEKFRIKVPDIKLAQQKSKDARDVYEKMIKGPP